jgi:hypothetical protein
MFCPALLPGYHKDGYGKDSYDKYGYDKYGESVPFQPHEAIVSCCMSHCAACQPASTSSLHLWELRKCGHLTNGCLLRCSAGYNKSGYTKYGYDKYGMDKYGESQKSFMLLDAQVLMPCMVSCLGN